MSTSQVVWIGPDGAGGVVTPDGVVRVPGALPGDVVDLGVVTRRGGARVAEGAVVVTPSADRITPACPVASTCGGCDLAAYGADARRSALAAMVRVAMRLDTSPPVVPSPRAVGHRARIRLALRDGIVGYRAARSHDLVPVVSCLAARPEVNDALARLRAALEGVTVPDGAVELRSDGQRVVFAVEGQGWDGSARAALAGLGDVALNGRALAGDPTLRLGDPPLFAPPDVFYQVNLEVNALLVASVVAAVAAASPQRVLDLYAGIGNLSLPIARLGVPVVAVELAGAAVAALQRSAEALGLTNVAARALDARRFDPSREAYDVAVLDPPREGAGEVLGRVLRNRPRRVVVVSCDPVAGGRDVGLARKAGYRVADVSCFDMFPDTHHVETVTVLDR